MNRRLAFAANAVGSRHGEYAVTLIRLRSAIATNRYLLQVALVVALYYAAAHIGFAFQFAGPVASIVWLPVGVGIAALYVLGLRLWPGIVDRRSAGQQLHGAAGRLSDRPELREPARGRDRRSPSAPAGEAGRAALDPVQPGRCACGHHGGNAGERDDRVAFAEAGGCGQCAVAPVGSGAPGGSATSAARRSCCHWCWPGCPPSRERWRRRSSRRRGPDACPRGRLEHGRDPGRPSRPHATSRFLRRSGPRCGFGPGARRSRSRSARPRDDPWYDAQPWTVRLRLDQRGVCSKSRSTSR